MRKILVGLVPLSLLLSACQTTSSENTPPVPYLGEGGQKDYQKWLYKKRNKAFFITEDGDYYYSWGYNQKSSMLQKTKEACEKETVATCMPYQVNDDVIYVAGPEVVNWQERLAASKAQQTQDGFFYQEGDWEVASKADIENATSQELVYGLFLRGAEPKTAYLKFKKQLVLFRSDGDDRASLGHFKIEAGSVKIKWRHRDELDNLKVEKKQVGGMAYFRFVDDGKVLLGFGV